MDYFGGSMTEAKHCPVCDGGIIDSHHNTIFCSKACRKRNELNGRIQTRWDLRISRLTERLHLTDNPKHRAEVKRLITVAKDKKSAAPYVNTRG
jgi:predicted nucleic acid-binding Zn ribbon protein